MHDILKIAAGVCLGMLAFTLLSVVLNELNPATWAARDLLDRQFAPAH